MGEIGRKYRDGIFSLVEVVIRWIEIFIPVRIVSSGPDLNRRQIAQIPEAPRIGFCADRRNEKELKIGVDFSRVLL